MTAGKTLVTWFSASPNPSTDRSVIGHQAAFLRIHSQNVYLYPARCRCPYPPPITAGSTSWNIHSKMNSFMIFSDILWIMWYPSALVCTQPHHTVNSWLKISLRSYSLHPQLSVTILKIQLTVKNVSQCHQPKLTKVLRWYVIWWWQLGLLCTCHYWRPKSGLDCLAEKNVEGRIFRKYSISAVDLNHLASICEQKLKNMSLLKEKLNQVACGHYFCRVTVWTSTATLPPVLQLLDSP